MIGVYPNWKTFLGICFSFADDLWAHPQQHRWLARQQSTSKSIRHGSVHTVALQTHFADPLGGPARNLNINEIVYIKSWGFLLMLHFRGVINVALFSVLAIVKFKKVDFVGNSTRTTVPETHHQGEAARQRSMRKKPTTPRAISESVNKSPINVS